MYWSMSQMKLRVNLVLPFEPFQTVQLSRRSVPWFLSNSLFSRCQPLEQMYWSMSPMKLRVNLVLPFEPFQTVQLSRWLVHWFLSYSLFSLYVSHLFEGQPLFGYKPSSILWALSNGSSPKATGALVHELSPIQLLKSVASRKVFRVLQANRAFNRKIALETSCSAQWALQLWFWVYL